jgi:CRISPR-associated protein Cas2
VDAVVTYDVRTASAEGDRRLQRVAKVCEHYGVRVQKSVFEVRLGETQMQRLVIALLDEMDQTEDTIIIYRLSGDLNDARTELGRRSGHRFGAPWIL